ncbi:hypothetical protein ACFSTE_19820 [Aquimarina hainanensis]|uniref:GLPGLI family protein n=1 Tax=Aquimarina hainanensis TaxID=1578017 RepID=A0ABW5NCX0_9FLAO|nr:hypothetical protein [Aquimarina sp. TRL1]QKX06429.1 hypothetical protein HN014_16420 [Aquimarina sp. TRL1]
MKKIAFIFILILSLHTISGQEFTASTDYIYTKTIKKTGKEYPSYVIDLYQNSDNDKSLVSFTIEDTELFEGIFLSVNKTPGLEGITEVIKIEVEYLGCCAHVDALYYMLTDENKVIKLPNLTNVYCTNSNADFQYTFPNQQHGIKNNILKTKTTYTDSHNKGFVTTKESFTWNNMNYAPSQSTAITSN